VIGIAFAFVARFGFDTLGAVLTAVVDASVAQWSCAIVSCESLFALTMIRSRTVESCETFSAISARIRIAVVDHLAAVFAAETVLAFGTFIITGADRLTFSRTTRLQIVARVDRLLTLESSKAWQANASIASIELDTHGCVGLRTLGVDRGAKVDFGLTVLAHKTRLTDAFVGRVEQVHAYAFVLTRFRVAVVDLGLAVASSKPVLAIASVSARLG